MKLNESFNSSLDEIEGSNQKYCNLSSGLIEKCMVARTRKIKELSAEEVRILMSQNIGLEYIVPFSLDILEKEPLIFGGLYKGDLLVALLNVDKSFWIKNPKWNNRLMEITIEIEEIYNTISEDILPLIGAMTYR